MTTAKKRAPKKPEPAPKHRPKTAETPALHILELRAENMLRLKAVRITPKGNLVQITGENGSGKSSVLDSILYALTGITGMPAEIIRRGEDKGGVRVDLGDLVVTRTMLRGGTHGGVLKIFQKSTKSILQQPQEVLNSLLGRISFDPLEFMRQSPADQLETLRSLVTVDVDIAAIDEANKADYDERRILDRQVREMRAFLAGMLEVAEPGELVDVEELARQLADAGRENTKRQELASIRQTLHRDHDEHKADADAAMQGVRERQRQIEILQQQNVAAEAKAAQSSKLAQGAIDKADRIEIPKGIDTADIERNLRDAQTANAEVQRRQQQRERRDVVVAEIERVDRQVQQLTEARDRRTQERTEAIARATMPIPGLSFGEGEVLYEELPLAQASSAQQIQVSVALAMASNPTIRVLRIKDGSLLSQRSVEQIAKMAEEKDYQVWMERVDTSGKVGVVMEDGEAHDANE